MSEEEQDYQSWDRIAHVDVPGGKVACYIYNDNPALPTLLALNGGPGLPCDYIRESHNFLAAHSFRFIAFDQLGTGQSDRSEDLSLYSMNRYCAEVDAVREALVDGPVHLLGHSWGGWLAIEYACQHKENLISLILEDTCADIPFLVSELQELRAALGEETVQMMTAFEQSGQLDHPAYQAAVTLLDYRHVCRLKEWPDAMKRSIENMSEHIYRHMQGANEFAYTGELASWSRIEDIHTVTCPVLILVGEHDEITPACARQMHAQFPTSELKLLPNCSHTPFFEDPKAFRKSLLEFLDGFRP